MATDSEVAVPVAVTTRPICASAPPFPTVKPDADKLLRALLDALTSQAWRDDAQVINASAAKRYATGDGPGVLVRLYEPMPDAATMERT